jgi:hypothetical protein
MFRIILNTWITYHFNMCMLFSSTWGWEIGSVSFDNSAREYNSSFRFLSYWRHNILIWLIRLKYTVLVYCIILIRIRQMDWRLNTWQRDGQRDILTYRHVICMNVMTFGQEFSQIC